MINLLMSICIGIAFYGAIKMGQILVYLLRYIFKPKQ